MMYRYIYRERERERERKSLSGTHETNGFGLILIWPNSTPQLPPIRGAPHHPLAGVQELGHPAAPGIHGITSRHTKGSFTTLNGEINTRMDTDVDINMDTDVDIDIDMDVDKDIDVEMDIDTDLDVAIHWGGPLKEVWVP